MFYCLYSIWNAIPNKHCTKYMQKTVTSRVKLDFPSVFIYVVMEKKNFVKINM